MVIGLLHGYKLNPDGTLHPQTEARAKKALECWRNKKIEKIMIMIFDRRTQTFQCAALKDWLLKQDVPRGDIVTFPWGRNTAGEIEGCIKFFELLHNKRFNLLRKSAEIVSISSWYHLPRIWFLWIVRGRSVKVAASWNGARLTDLLAEPLKIVNAVLRPFASAKTIKNTKY